MKTYSRYDFMQEGRVKDEISGNYYPDPLSLNYLSFFLDSHNSGSIPKERRLSETDIKFFLEEVSSVYTAPIYDDIVLTLNGVSHKNFLNIGDVIKFPDVNLIESSFEKGR